MLIVLEYPDPKTGHIYKWSEEQFIARFRAGKIYQDSPMSWKAFSKMPEVELKANYRYLKSLSPVENEVGPRNLATNALQCQVTQGNL